MSRFGWAYVNDVITGSAAAAGPTNSVQFNSGSGVFSGSSNFTFNPSTNVLTVVGTISASNYLGVSGSGGTTSPAGSNKYLQYNSGSVFGASSNLIFDYTTNELILTGNVRVVGQVSAFYLNGNKFAEQKICLLDGFDYYKVGVVDGYQIVNKELVKL